MAGYLEGYGAGEAERERTIKRLFIALGAILIAAIAGYFLFRDYREKKQAQLFMDLLKSRDYKSAYALWGCTDTAPCRDYKFEKFLEDWGTKDVAAVNVSTQHCANGIIQTLKWPKDEVPLWVNRGDLQLSYAPWPRCDFHFRAPH